MITADLVTAGKGLHARSVGPAHHTLLLLTTGRLLVLTIDFTKEIVLDNKYVHFFCKLSSVQFKHDNLASQSAQLLLEVMALATVICGRLLRQPSVLLKLTKKSQS